MQEGFFGELPVEEVDVRPRRQSSKPDQRLRCPVCGSYDNINFPLKNPTRTDVANWYCYPCWDRITQARKRA